MSLTAPSFIVNAAALVGQALDTAGNKEKSPKTYRFLSSDKLEEPQSFLLPFLYGIVQKTITFAQPEMRLTKPLNH
eukprot:scaffold120757_cov41-Prasinocladus_malaysianus.AAC.1